MLSRYPFQHQLTNVIRSLQYAFASQVSSRGLNPADAIIEMAPRPGEFCLREEDILATIRDHGRSIALVAFSGVQYYTGQWFPIESITKAAHEQVRFNRDFTELMI